MRLITPKRRPRMKRWLPLFEDMPEFRDFMNSFEFLPVKKNEGGLSVYEDSNHVFVEAALPGIPVQDIQVSYEGGVLWIKGEKKEEKKEVKYHVKSSQSFSYRIPIPSQVDEKAEPDAVSKNGILKITFTKSKGSKGKKISIKGR
jgi:HSP20 family protein